MPSTRPITMLVSSLKRRCLRGSVATTPRVSGPVCRTKQCASPQRALDYGRNLYNALCEGMAWLACKTRAVGAEQEISERSGVIGGAMRYSNQGPGQFYRLRAIGSVRDRGPSRTPPHCDSVCGSCNVGVNPPWVRRFQAVGTVRAKTLEDRKDGKSRRREVAVHRPPP
jgi:hypothetical protein